ncbi:hypothetical protein AVEN_99138-1, partial [Araneus ventricosus]
TRSAKFANPQQEINQERVRSEKEDVSPCSKDFKSPICVKVVKTICGPRVNLKPWSLGVVSLNHFCSCRVGRPTSVSRVGQGPKPSVLCRVVTP